jgi:hypothetical protein
VHAQPEVTPGHRELVRRRVQQAGRQVDVVERGAADPEKVPRGPVDQDDPAPVVDDDDTVGNRVERRPVESPPPEHRPRRDPGGRREERGDDPVGTSAWGAVAPVRRVGCHRLSIGRRLPHLIEHVF